MAVKLILLVALLAIMSAEGTRITSGDLRTAWKRPEALVRGVISVIVIVPIIALFTAVTIHPSRAVAIGLCFLAAAPLAPFILTKLARTGEDFRLGASLHVVLAVLSIVTAPIVIAVLGAALDFRTIAQPVAIGGKVLTSLLLPFGVGVALATRRPRLAERLRRPLELIGIVTLLFGCALLFIGGRHYFAEFGARDYAAMITFCVLSLASGHLIAAHDDERTTYALESAARNPGVALLIATSSLGPVRGAMLLPYLVIFIVISSFYVAVRKRATAHRPSIA